MKRLLVAALLAAGPATAQPTLASGQLLEGHFAQERWLAGATAPLRSEGRFTLVPERGLVWRIENPVDAATALTEAGLAQSIEHGPTTRIPADRIAFLARLPLMLAAALAGDWAPLERMFKVDRRTDGARWTAALVPRSGDAPIEEILVTGSGLVDSVEIRRRDGARDRLEFSRQVARFGRPSEADEALLAAAAR